MAKQSTILIPAQDKKGNLSTIEAQGKVAWLHVGKTRWKFFLQEQAGGRETGLTDWWSGRRLASLTPIKLRHSRSYQRLTDRAAAEILLGELVDKFGEDGVLEKLRGAKRINGVKA